MKAEVALHVGNSEEFITYGDEHTHVHTQRCPPPCLWPVSSVLSTNVTFRHLLGSKSCWLKHEGSLVGVRAMCLTDGLCQAAEPQAEQEGLLALVSDLSRPKRAGPSHFFPHPLWPFWGCDAFQQAGEEFLWRGRDRRKRKDLSSCYKGGRIGDGGWCLRGGRVRLCVQGVSGPQPGKNSWFRFTQSPWSSLLCVKFYPSVLPTGFPLGCKSTNYFL